MSGAIFMLYKVTDDTLIRSQSLPTNTTFQALSKSDGKLENTVSSYSNFCQMAYLGILDEMG